MRSLIVGTAGHIDHGKSALVRALTGTDPDRLKEEKERGITIDLGFAHLDLGGGRVASFIDVPGHERFVRNMLAGAHGIDAVLLVVAADESVMPQTREHFHICRLLGIPRGLVALTKCDAADGELVALAEMEVRELVAGSFLEGAPVLRLSARTGQGLDELRAVLRTLAETGRARPKEGLLRLPVDRVFVLRGFGTVVTGTLVSGALAVGEEVEVLPSRRRARVRGLHVHGASVDEVEAGNRVAVNLAGLEATDLVRGEVLTRPGTLRPTMLLDVELSLLPGERALKDHARIRVHLASAERLARVRIPGSGRIEPGGRARVQLRLETAAVAGRGDRLIIRSYSPPTTIGGAEVLDPLPPRRRRAPAEVVPAGEDTAELARRLLQEAGPGGLDAPMLAARLTVPATALAAIVKEAPEILAFGRDPVTYLSRSIVQGLTDQAASTLERYHRENPLKPAMPREELRARVFGRSPNGLFEHVLSAMSAEGRARQVSDGVALASHAVRLTTDEAAARAELLAAAEAAGLEGVEPGRAVKPGGDARVVERVSRVLLAEGLLRRVGDALVHREALETLKVDVRRRWPPGSRLDVGSFKELTGLSRKFVIPLLEYLDRERVTRRSGNDRLVLA